MKISTKEMEDVAAEGEEGGDAPSPGPTLDAKTQKKLMKALREVVAREVELKTSDGKDGVEHVTATAPFRTLITELLGEIRPLAKDLPPGMELPTDKDLKDAPDTDATADFTLKNGELTEVDIDLAKLAEDADVKKLGVTLRITDGTRPTAPAGATELDPAAVMGASSPARGRTRGSSPRAASPTRTSRRTSSDRAERDRCGHRTRTVSGRASAARPLSGPRAVHGPGRTTP